MTVWIERCAVYSVPALNQCCMHNWRDIAILHSRQTLQTELLSQGFYQGLNNVLLQMLEEPRKKTVLRM